MDRRKSGLRFSKNCWAQVREILKTRLVMDECNDELVYLGNPLCLGRNRSTTFDFFKKKVHGRLEWWMAK